ncbi:hypothetical protein R1flu_014848 [Riccia fluitans]|uniref:Vacuolar protein 8 n=1 Tax=Riccia fluitans TaxID=41844 RepID=A0ABD1YKE4_9MARC
MENGVGFLLWGTAQTAGTCYTQFPVRMRVVTKKEDFRLNSKRSWIKIPMEQLAVHNDNGEQSGKIVVDKARSEQRSDGLRGRSIQSLKTRMKDKTHNQKASGATKLSGQVGLLKILSLLDCEDNHVRHRAVEVVASLAAKEENKDKIVQLGGLCSILKLLESSEEEERTCRVAAGAVASLATKESNQELIIAQGGVGLLSRTADDAQDSETLRMVACAIANLCKNGNLQLKLGEQGAIRALLRMAKSRHPDVLAEVARGFANFAECESQGVARGVKTGRSLLIDDGALPWIVANANSDSSSVRSHIELALFRLAQHEVHAQDLITGGALRELVRIYLECHCETIRTLARRSFTTFQTELFRRETSAVAFKI